MSHPRERGRERGKDERLHNSSLTSGSFELLCNPTVRTSAPFPFLVDLDTFVCGWKCGSNEGNCAS